MPRHWSCKQSEVVFGRDNRDSAFRLDLPAYLKMYLVVSVENLKLYELPLFMHTEEFAQIPTVDDFTP